MKSSKQDKVEGNLHKAKGKIKEIVGKVVSRFVRKMGPS